MSAPSPIEKPSAELNPGYWSNWPGLMPTRIAGFFHRLWTQLFGPFESQTDYVARKVLENLETNAQVKVKLLSAQPLKKKKIVKGYVDNGIAAMIGEIKGEEITSFKRKLKKSPQGEIIKGMLKRVYVNVAGSYQEKIKTNINAIDSAISYAAEKALAQRQQKSAGIDLAQRIFIPAASDTKVNYAKTIIAKTPRSSLPNVIQPNIEIDEEMEDLLEQMALDISNCLQESSTLLQLAKLVPSKDINFRSHLFEDIDDLREYWNEVLVQLTDYGVDINSLDKTVQEKLNQVNQNIEGVFQILEQNIKGKTSLP